MLTRFLLRATTLLLSLGFMLSPIALYAGDGGGGGGGGGALTCTFTGAVGFDWTTSSNWNCGRVPLSGDIVIIPGGQSVQLTSGAAAGGDIQIATGGNLTISGGTLTASGSLTNAGTFITTGGEVSVQGISNSGDVELNGGTIDTGIGGTLTNTGTMNGSGTGTVLTTGGIGNFGTINHIGGWQIRVGQYGYNGIGTYNSIADDSIFRYTSSDSDRIQTQLVYPNLEFGGSMSVTDGSQITSRGNVTLLSGLTFSANSSTFVVPGNWVAESNSSISNNHTTVEFTGSATSTITVGSAGALFYEIRVNKDASDKGVQLLSDATALHALVLTQGLFDENGFTLTLPQSCLFTGGGGTTAWETSTNWDCSGTPRLPGVADVVTIPALQVVTVSSAGGALTPAPSAGHLNVETGATLEVQASGLLIVYGTSTNAGVIEVNMAGGAIPGRLSLLGGSYATSTNDGTIRGTSGATLSAYVPLENLGTIDMSSGGKLTLGVNMGTVGDLDVSGSGDLTLEGPGFNMGLPPRFIPATSPIGTLTIAISAMDSIALAASVTTTQALNIVTGTLSIGAHTLTLDGTASLTSSAGTGSFDASGGTLIFTGAGDQTLSSSFSLSAPNVLVRKTSGSVSQNASLVSIYGSFEVVTGTYAIESGALTAYSSFIIDAPGFVTSTGGGIVGMSGLTNMGSLNTDASLIVNSGLTNSGTSTLNGLSLITGGLTNNGALTMSSVASMSVDSLTNNGNFLGDASGGQLTLSADFTAGSGSAFSAPQTVNFSGPATMPPYSYHTVNILSDTTLATSTGNLSFGDVTVTGGMFGRTWTVQNTGSAQTDVNITIDTLTIQSGSGAVFSGVAAGPLTDATPGPTVTTTGSLLNDGTLTINDTNFNLAGGLSGSGVFDFSGNDIGFYGSASANIPSATYRQLSLLGSGTYTLSASTTVMTTTTVASSATLDLSTNRLNALGDIANTGLITVGIGGVLHHPVDYVRFSDGSGSLVSSLTDGNSLYVTVKDQSRNLNGGVAETILTTVTSTVPAGSDSEALTLTETSPSSGIFRNASAIPVHGAVSIVSANGIFDIIGDGQAQTTYTDSIDDSDSSSTSVGVTYTQPTAPATPAPRVDTGGGAIGAAGGGAIGNILLWSYSTPRSTTPSSSSPTSFSELPLASGSIAPSPNNESAPLPPASSGAILFVRGDARGFNVATTPLLEERLASFIDYGTNDATRKLGSGERRALVRDLLDTMRTSDLSVEDLERVAAGQIPLRRNRSQEIAQLPRVRSTFRALYGHEPNFKDPEQDLAWNTLMYRIRFPRDLIKEKQGITEFKQVFKKNPQTPFQWATVRVMGYIED